MGNMLLPLVESPYIQTVEYSLNTYEGIVVDSKVT